MIIYDNRTEEEKKSHSLLVVATDPFSSCGCGRSYTAWACLGQHVDRVEAWVKSRKDLQRVRVVSAYGYHPKGKGHLYIYIVKTGHVALKTERRRNYEKTRNKTTS